MSETHTRPNAGRFQPGQSGNPKGRPVGSRHKLGEQFLAGLQADFAEHGQKVIEKVRTELPHVYLKIIASTLPKELKIDPASNDPRDYTEAELLEIINRCEDERKAGEGLN
ncbi:MAG: DUF5681 domain-containing protein [Hyphomicrobiaceae bacterium]